MDFVRERGGFTGVGILFFVLWSPRLKLQTYVLLMVVMWCYGSDRGVDDYVSKFVSSDTWNQIRQLRDRVNWSKLVWFSQGIPRYAFITWLTIWDRLSTGHRTSIWGQPQCCVFCGEPDETRDQLFLLVPISLWHGWGGRESVWKGAWPRLGHNSVSPAHGFVWSSHFHLCRDVMLWWSKVGVILKSRTWVPVLSS